MTLEHLIADFVRRHARAYLGSAVMLVAIALLTVWVPRQVGRLVDQLATGGAAARDALPLGLALLLGAGLLIYFLRVGWRLMLYAASYELGRELRLRLYARLAAQGPRFYQQRRTGDLMALATNDVDAIEMAAGEALLAAFDGTLTLLLVVATMALGVDWRLALVVLLPFPAMALSFWWITRQVHQASHDALESFSRLNDQVQETLAGVRTLRALGLEPRSSARFATLAGEAADRAEREQRWEAAYEPAVSITLSMAVVLSLGFGGWLVWRDEMTIGQLTSFGLYLGQLIWPMFAAGWVLALLQRGRAAWARLQPVLDEPLAVDDHGSRATPPQGAIELHDLRFAYPGATRPALDGVSLQLAPGRTLGLVGATGAGKSTLLKLLQRHWAPDAGRITWGGVALPDHTLAALRAATAWVPQEAFLFSASVAENIALARPEATRAQVQAVARAAAVHDDIVALPQGYDTVVGERGITLSGGQRQRVAIARALLADAPLLLLDDALSAVDTGTEARILAALRAARRDAARDGGGTAAPMVVIASHRLSTLMDADEIIVLRAGRVAERGTHAELVALGGWYATQWRVQQLEASIDAG